MKAKLHPILEFIAVIIKSCEQCGHNTNTEAVILSIIENFFKKTIPTLKAAREITIEQFMECGADKFVSQCIRIAVANVNEDDLTLDFDERMRILFAGIVEQGNYIGITEHRAEIIDRGGIDEIMFLRRLIRAENFVAYPAGSDSETGPNKEFTHRLLCERLIDEVAPHPRVVWYENGLYEVLPMHEKPAKPVIRDPLWELDKLTGELLQSERNGLCWKNVPTTWQGVIYVGSFLTNEIGSKITDLEIYKNCLTPKMFWEFVNKKCPFAGIWIARCLRFGLTLPNIVMEAELREAASLRRFQSYEDNTVPIEWRKIRHVIDEIPNLLADGEESREEGMLRQMVEAYDPAAPTNKGAAKWLGKLAEVKRCIVIGKDSQIDVERTIKLFRRIMAGETAVSVYIDGDEIFEVVGLGEMPIIKPYRLNAWDGTETYDGPDGLDIDLALSILDLSLPYDTCYMPHEKLTRMIASVADIGALEKLIVKYPKSALIIAQRHRCNLTLPIYQPVLRKDGFEHRKRLAMNE